MTDAVVSRVGASKAAVEETISAVLATISMEVVAGNAVQSIGFGTFGSGERAACPGRNLRTGVAIKIAAAKTVKFTAGKALKDAVNQYSGAGERYGRLKAIGLR